MYLLHGYYGKPAMYLYYIVYWEGEDQSIIEVHHTPWRSGIA